MRIGLRIIFTRWWYTIKHNKWKSRICTNLFFVNTLTDQALLRCDFLWGDHLLQDIVRSFTLVFCNFWHVLFILNAEHQFLPHSSHHTTRFAVLSLWYFSIVMQCFSVKLYLFLFDAHFKHFHVSGFMNSCLAFAYEYRESNGNEKREKTEKKKKK